MEHNGKERDHYALSSSQMNIWQLERAFSGTAINNICETIRIRGLFDVSLAQRCLNHVVKTDSTLRTQITVGSDGVPVQYETEYSPFTWPVFDFSKTGYPGLEHWEQTVTRQVMPVLEHPLFYFAVIRINQNEGGILIKTHHLISDGWSQVALINRIVHTYMDLLSGKEPETVMTPSYRLHVEEETKYLNSDAARRDTDFWRETAGQMPPPVSVKDCDIPVLSPVGQRKTFALSDVLNHAINTYCEEHRIAPFAVFYMALAIYIKRIRGVSKCCIGAPVHNRATAADRSTMGMFVSTLPFCSQLDETLSFEDFTWQLAETWLDLLKHQKLPFSEIFKLIKAGQPDTERLFNIVLSFHNSKAYQCRETSISFSGQWHYSGFQAEHLCIHLNNIEDERRFSVNYDYLTQLFTEHEIEQLHYYLTGILTRALATPATPIKELFMLGEAEKEQVLYTFNHTDAFLGGDTIDTAMVKQCRNHAKKAAVIQNGRRTTYSDLYREAGKIAAALLPFGGGDKRAVALFIPKSAELLAAMLGAAKAGLPWVILPPDLPEQRLAEIIADSGAGVIIGNRAVTGQPQALNIPFIDTENLPEPADAVFPDVTGRDLAYMIYTSGSTGNPKGIGIEQSSLMNFAEAMKPLYPGGAVLSLCHIGFDAFLIESVVALINGRTIVLPSSEELESPAQLARLITNYAVGFLSLTPSRLAAYLKNDEFYKAAARLEVIICGGESFPANLLHLLQKCTGARIYNQYGPSETTVGVTTKLLNHAPTLSVGTPMRNCRCYVLNDDLAPVPIGVCGELYIGGLCVGRGYRNNPELNGKSFIDSPFESGERLYRTGDIAAWTLEGELLIKGRQDGQVKLRGQRIELDEIAARLTAHPAIKQAAARVSDIDGQPVLTAYYSSEAPINESELFGFASETLPGYMVPSLFAFIPEFPLTPNGKIDINRLPAPDLPKDTRLVLNETGEKILSVFRQVLNRPGLTAASDYFLCGGDSLNALEALEQLYELLNVRLRVADLYSSRTAYRLQTLLTGKAHMEVPRSNITKMPAQQSYPLTAEQLGIYFESQRCKDNVAYNMPCGFTTSVPLDEDRLRYALQQLVETEPILRSVFIYKDGEIRQKVTAFCKTNLEILNTDTLAQAKAAFVRPFDLTTPPLLHMALWRNREGENAVLLDLHHIVGDGVSAAVLLNRLDVFYRGGQISLPDINYFDYACFAEQSVPSGETVDYWRRQLTDLPALPALPTDFSRANQFDYKGSFCEFELTDEESRRCDEFCAQQGLTTSALFTGAFTLLISKLSGSQDFFTGIPVSNRRDPSLSETVGLLIKTLPLRITARDDLPALDYFLQVRDGFAGLLDHADISFNQLMDMAGSDGKRGSLYNTISSMRPFDIAVYTFDGQPVTPEIVPGGSAKTDLNLESARVGQVYRFRLEYATGLYEHETAALYGRCFTAILLETCYNPARKLQEYTALMPADRYKLYEQPDALSAAFANLPVHKQVENAALINPLAPAVIFHGGTTTFEQIITESNALAAAMLREGLREGDAVAILCRRGPWLVTAMLAALKIGCVYVPVLPTFPKNRIESMLSISGAGLTLCDSDTFAALPEGLPGRFMDIGQVDHTAAVLPAGKYENPLCCILFTSGTTGQPKGVMLRHRSVANLIGAIGGTLGRVNGAFLCAANPIFDIFITETLIALSLGKTVVMADEEEMVTPWKAAELVRNFNVQFIEFTPSRAKLFFGNDAFFSAVTGIQHTIMCGEVLPPQLLEKIRSAGIKTIWNMYGPTETTVYSTMDDVTNVSRITIGKMFANSRGYILNDRLQRVLPTAQGELYFSGDCLAAGYVGREDLTNDSFIPDPFHQGEVMYKSGDIVRLLPDGRIDFVGRRDHQVKFNGQRIELAEITQKLLDSKLAHQAATVVAQSGDFPVLRSFVTPHAGQKLNETALRDYLKTELPPFMIPSEIHILEELPRTETGKVDIQALTAFTPVTPANQPESRAAEPENVILPPVPVGANSVRPQEPPISGDEHSSSLQVESAYDHAPESKPAPEVVVDPVPPPAPVQAATPQALAGLWESVLSRSDINPEQSFFEQGGTSLGALSLLSSYYNLGFTLSLEEFYNAPTLTAHQMMLSLKQTTVPDTGAVHEKNGVLVTGATGFLGAHLVKALIDAGYTEVFCIVRGDPDRLYDTLGGYFGEDWTTSSRPKIHAMCGDIVAANAGLSEADLTKVTAGTKFILHAAADVRHYACDNTPIQTNVEGTKQIIELAYKSFAKLIYISTVSIGGEYMPGRPEITREFCERDFDIGQNWQDSIYLRGKFMAEQEVHKAADQGLNTLILRIGRLVGRSSDGMFQKNAASNTFYELVKGMLCLDMIDTELASLPLDLTAVDECAAAAVTLMKCHEPVYHLFQPKVMPIRNILKDLGKTLPETDRESFKRHLNDKIQQGFGLTLAPLISQYNRFCAIPFRIISVCRETQVELMRQGFIWRSPDPRKLLERFL